MAENTDSTSPPASFSRLVRFNRISKAKSFEFDEKPTEAELRAIARDLGALSVRKMRFSGTLAPLGRDGWQLEGTLGATVTQACVITLEPVRTRLDLEVRRRFLPEPDYDSESLEIEYSGDDEVEPLEATLDLGHVAIEALALALPDYPKAEGAELPPEAIDGDDDSADGDSQNPFAGLAALKDTLDKDG